MGTPTTFWKTARFCLVTLCILVTIGVAAWGFKTERQRQRNSEDIATLDTTMTVVKAEVESSAVRLDSINQALRHHRDAAGPAIETVLDLRREIRAARTDNALILLRLDELDSLLARAIDQ